MKKIPLALFLFALTLSAHATLMEVTGAFAGFPNQNGLIHPLSGGFTAYFDDAAVATTGNFTLDNLTLSDLNLSNPLIGATVFDKTNTFLDLGFHNGSLISFTLGDITNNILAPGIDDFSVYFEQNAGLILFSIGVTEKASGYFGTDFRAFDPSTGSFSVTPASSVPDSASTALIVVAACLSLAAFRRFQSADVCRLA